MSSPPQTPSLGPESRVARILLAAEATFLLFVVPGGLWAIRALGGYVPVIPMLVLLGLGTYGFLRLRAPELLRGWVDTPWPPREVRRVGLQFGCATFLLTLYVHYLDPKGFLALPQHKPWFWGMIVFTYPFLSVLPQELFFRGFFFHRYGELLPSRASRVLVSALAFGFAHVFYGNAIAVGLSSIGGVLFGWTFARTRSISLVTVEHALYGVALFTVGLGHHFWISGAQVL